MPEQLERLAAQDSLYDAATRNQAVQTFLTVPVVVAFSLLSFFAPAVKVYSACWAMILLFLDVFVFEAREKELKIEAAKIKEQFDCDVLQLPWRALMVGTRPDASVTSEFAAKYRARHKAFSQLYEWYRPEVGQLPIEIARISCQAENCDWDSKLRRKYAKYVALSVGLFLACMLFVGLIGGVSLDGFVLAVLYPVLPAVKLGVQQYRRHNQAADALDRLKDYCTRTWREAIAGTAKVAELEMRCRELQDEIFKQRCQDPLAPKRIYRWLARKYSGHLRNAALERIDEALKNMSGLKGPGRPEL